jgi:hypothetical protein
VPDHPKGCKEERYPGRLDEDEIAIGELPRQKVHRCAEVDAIVVLGDAVQAVLAREAEQREPEGDEASAQQENSADRRVIAKAAKRAHRRAPCDVKDMATRAPFVA